MTVVPERYHGVWARTLLETPGGRDTTTWVRWLQTGLWHGDLRVPADADRRTPQGLAQQQGFAGTTAITRPDPDQPEVCTCVRSIIERGLFGPNSFMIRHHSRRAARSLAISR